MTTQAAAHRSPVAGAFPPAIGVGVAVLAALVLVGWVFGLPSLKSVLPGFARMQVNTALCFVLSGVGLALLSARPPARRVVGRVCAALTCGLALLSLLEHLTPTGLKLDRWHLAALESLTGVQLVGRMSIAVAFSFLLFGTALLLLDAPRRSAWFTDLLVILPLLLCVLTLTGDAFNFFAPAGARLSPLPTVLTFITLGLGLLAARPDRGGMAVLSSPYLGGTLARRLLPAAVLVPFLLGWLRLLAEQSGALGRAIGPALSVLADVVVFSGFVLWYAAALNRTDEARQRAVEDLRRKERHFRALIESSHDAVTLHGPDGTILYASPATRNVLGYAPEELVGRNALTLVHPDDAAAFNAGGEYRVRHKDGTYRWVEATATDLRADPDVGAVVTSLRDIEERKRSEHAIAGYAERLRILRQIDRALISGVRPEEIAVGALPLLRDLLRVGRTIVNLFELDKGEVEWLAAAGRKRVQARPGVRYSLRLMGDVEALKRGQPQMIDTHALPPGPEVDALLASGVDSYAVVPMIAGGELIGALSFGGSSVPVTDEQIGIAQEVATQFAISLTQARLLERVQRQAEELEFRVRERTAQLEAANRELEAFSYSVSHDLRAPLRAINGFSRILMDEYAELLPETARDHLREVRDSAREMGQLVDGLLTFSRLSRQPIAAREVRPRELVERCLDELREERAGRDVDVTVGPLPECHGDPVLLKQVWFNLLSNALKYTRGRSPTRIEVGSQADSATSAVTTYFVRDNGVGFDMRYADKLFGVFQRLHRAEEYEGTGVGLAIVQRIVQRHGGRIWAEAQVGEGATFYFTLEGEP